MNPLLTVDPKIVKLINTQNNIPDSKLKSISFQIKYYLTLCEADASSLTSKPKMQHIIPKFLLRDFEGEVNGQDRLKVIKYDLHPSGKVISISDLPNITSAGFSKQPDFYSIDDLSQKYQIQHSDKYFVEKLISVVEKNAAPLLKLRQQPDFYNPKTYSNPYWYPDELMEEKHKVSSSSILDGTTGRRIALSAFFAVQYLRSYFMYKSLKKNNIRAQYENGSFANLSEKDFPYFIQTMLPDVTEYFYSRAWRWVYSPFDGMMPGGTAVVPLFLNEKQEDIGQEHSYIMTLGRNSTIYFLQQNSFFEGHDGVFYSDCLGVSTWSIQHLLLALALDLSANPTKANTREARICMHPQTNLAHIFKTEQEVDFKLLTKMTNFPDNEDLRLQSLSFLGNISRR